MPDLRTGPPRLGVWCAACQAATAIVFGRLGYEVRDCLACGRRRSIRDEIRERALAAATVQADRAWAA